MADRNRSPGLRPGFSLVEMLVALTLFGSLIAISINVMNQQVRTFYNGSAGADAAQQLRFSMNVLDSHIANVGAGVPSGQPQLVYADSNVVVFNTNWMSNVMGDPFAVNVDSTMPLSWVMAVPKSRKFTIPTTAVQYPDTTYMEVGSNSPAETVTFWFAPDTTTAATDYILWRQVNDQVPEMIARNLLKPARGPFFRFYRHFNPVSGSARLDTVPTAWLPLRHIVPIHGSNTDTASLARVDSVRAIDVAFQTTDALPAPKTRTYSLSRTVALPNAGKEVKKTCGDEPLLQATVAFAAKDTADAFGTPSVIVRWNASVDEAAGEKDVLRYVLWRSTTTFAFGVVGDPFLSIPAGSATYEYRDTSVQPLTTYFWALAAQDCTPSLSNLKTATVIVP